MDVMVAEHETAGATVVSLWGQLDLDTAGQLRDVLAPLLARPVPRIVVHLAGLTFCDSIGLSTLAMGHNRCVDAGGYLRLSAPTPFLLRVLTVVGLVPLLPTYRTVEHACFADPAGLIAPAG